MVDVKVGVTPDFFQSSHGGIGCGKSGCDVVVVAQVVGDERAEISKGPREANNSIGYGEVLGFVKFIVHGMFVFSLPWVVLVFFISGVYLSSSIGVVSGK